MVDNTENTDIGVIILRDPPPVVSIYFYSPAQTDSGLRSITFSLKFNKLPTFSEITEEWQCLKIVLYGQMSSHTEF